MERIALSLLLSRTRQAASLDDVFNELVRALETCGEEDGGPVTVLTSRPPYVVHANGYLKTIRSCVSKVMKQHKNELTYHVQPDPFSKMLVSIVITPRPNKGQKVKFTNGVAKFVDSPYKGHTVSWSKRLKINGDELAEKYQGQMIDVCPDLWNNTFYGWVPKTTSSPMK